jgi:diguanylate cyclase (GGDEF)-like protein
MNEQDRSSQPPPASGGDFMNVDSVWLGDRKQALPFFKDLTEPDLRHPALFSTKREYAADSTVIARGNQPASLFILWSGVARVLESGPSDEAAQSPYLLTASSGPAEPSEPSEERQGLLLLDGSAASSSVQALVPCTFLQFSREQFLNFLSRSPRLLARLFAEMPREIRSRNAKLFSDALEAQACWMEKEREQQAMLDQLLLGVGDAENAEAALQLAVDRFCAVLGWPVGHVYSADEKSSGDLFSSSIWHLRTPAQHEPFRRVSDVTAYSAGLGLPGRVLATKAPVWIEDITEIRNSPRAKAAREVGLKTGLGIPIMIQQDLFAVLEFFNPQALPPDAWMMEKLASVATRLGRGLERKQYEQRLVHNAFHDSLTGLPNRALFLDHLALSMARARRNPQALYAVLFLDLDRFKVINDSLGHLVADRTLIEVAARLQTMLRATDTVARFGGDEFAVLLDDLREISNVPRMVERIRKELQVPVRLGDQEVYTSASIGVVIGSADYSQPEDILQDADIALYQAKTQGRARYIIFDTGMRERAMQLLQVEMDLRQAMERQELRVFYQPIVSLETGKITGFEALLRWQHPERGLLSAGQFLPVAEETEIIIPISKWVLGEVCAQLQVWQRQFLSDPPVSVSVNLTSRYLSKPDLVEEVTHLIDQSHIDPHSLRLEITESQIMEDPKAISKTLVDLSSYGVQVYIDDFGTGYSSLSYLSNFRVQALKIDYSFIKKLNGDDRDDAIVRAVVGLGLNLGLDVVAEGVETPDQLEFLRTIRCQYGQGYYFCRPVDKDSASQLLSDGGRLDKEERTDGSRLRAYELFAELGDSELEEIAAMARVQVVEPETLVIRQGQVGNEVYLLDEGLVEIFREDKSGSHFVAKLQAPAFFGERALLDPERIRTASVKALTHLHLLVIRIDSVLALLRRFPSLRERMRGLFVERT